MGEIIITVLITIILSVVLDKIIIGKKMKIKEYIKDKRKLIEIGIITIIVGGFTVIMGITVNTVLLELLLIVLYRIVAIDIKEKIIDMRAFIILSIIAATSLFIDNGVNIMDSIITGISASIMFYITSKLTHNAFGMGDAMVLSVLGVVFGYQGLFGILIISSLIGFIVSITLLIKNGFKKGKNIEMPFTPFIFISIMILMIFNNI